MIYLRKSDVKKDIILDLKSVTVFLLFFVIPFVVMNSCEGWNAGNMETQSCAIDFWLIRMYADLYFAFIMFSSICYYNLFFSTLLSV